MVDWSLVLEGGESQTLEFKNALPDEASLARNMTAFANKHGGLLVIGIEDNGNVLGLSAEAAERGVKTLRTVADSLFSWPVEIATAQVQGKTVAYASIPPVPRDRWPLANARGQIYVREGGTNVPRHRAELLPQPPAESKPSKSPARVFVAMSFREEEEPALVDYYKAMERAAERCNVELLRVDLEKGVGDILQKTHKMIEDANAVIADFTLNSNNVYFELGYAVARGKPFIQTARKGTELGFDVKGNRTLFYRNAAELEAQLISELPARLQGRKP